MKILVVYRYFFLSFLYVSFSTYSSFEYEMSHVISRHLDPIINSCYVIKYIICGLQMGVSVPSGCFSTVYKHDKGVSFQRQRNYFPSHCDGSS